MKFTTMASPGPEFVKEPTEREVVVDEDTFAPEDVVMGVEEEVEETADDLIADLAAKMANEREAEPIKRGPGRPRKDGTPNQRKETTRFADSVKSKLPLGDTTSVLSGSFEKTLSRRGQQILRAFTLIPAGIAERPFIEMTAEEAMNIADPLASYATRQAEYVPMLKTALENFDLIAAAASVMVYVARVLKDERDFKAVKPRATRTPRQPNPVDSSVRGGEDSNPTERSNGYRNQNGVENPTNPYAGISIPDVGEL